MSLIREDIHIAIDSGAFSIYVDMNNRRKIPNFSETKEFWDYVDSYGSWLQENEQYLEMYVNLDVIFNPEATYKVQKYLENNFGLHPIPVLHPREDFKWLKLYMDNYPYIGIGGLGQDFPKEQWMGFGDKVFDMVCPLPSKLPKWKIHGFAVTSVDIMFRYPFYSVDSSSWVKYAAFGWIAVPKYDIIEKRYLYDKTPQIIAISTRHPFMSREGRGFNTYSLLEQKYIQNYIEEQGFKIGKSEWKKVKSDYKLQQNESWFKKGEIVEVLIERGLCNNTYDRDDFCISYTIDVANHIPEWPWPFHGGESRIKRFGLLKKEVE